METWVKLYRNLLTNDLILDRVALQIFIYCLLKCDDKGRLRVSRYRTSSYLELHPETFRKGLERLKKDERITTKSTSQFTVVLISNWSKYQAPSTKRSTHAVPTEYQRSTTYNKNRIEYKKTDDWFRNKPPEGHIPYVPRESDLLPIQERINNKGE